MYLSAISPLDGRYSSKLAPLVPFYSEYALIKYRIWVEIEYYIALNTLVSIPGFAPLSETSIGFLRGIYLDFSEADAQKVKDIEKVTNHDVKAVEYYIKAQIDAAQIEELIKHKEFIHFGLTSQDINNTAIPRMMLDAMETVYLPKLREIITTLTGFAHTWADVPLLAYTHGQPASPTTLGKELAVFVARLEAQATELSEAKYPAKFGGATGNLNAHFIAYPEIQWNDFAQVFVTERLGLHRSYPTTQIEHYDGLARIFHNIQRINSILIDLCQDCWLYISKEYFRQKTKEGEVGSSAMPHKVNPIDFENAEGNCGMSTAILAFLSQKLPISRLQRDLTDSTLLRNVGMGVGYSYLALTSILNGLGKLVMNQTKIQADLDANWAVLAEPIQTILRREAFPNPYEALKALTRGNHNVTAESLRAFIMELEVEDKIKAELLALTPERYVGDASAAAKGI